MDRQYSEPVLYDCKGDIKKPWYVYFQYRNPATGKMERQPSITSGINKHKKKSDRYKAARILIQVVSDILANGWNPYDDDSSPLGKEVKMTIHEASKFALDIKRRQYATGYKSFESHVLRFQKWLDENGFKGLYVTRITKKTVIDYLNNVLSATSAANRNNARSNLSVFFQVLEDNEIIPINFIKKINVIKSKPQRNKSYTLSQENDIYDFLALEHPVMLTYIMFISYNFVRPIEVNRLRIRDVDQRNRRLHYRAKNKLVKIKIIPEVLAKELPDLSRFPQDAFLFGMTGIGQEWESTEVSRRDFYTKQFLKLVKKKFGLAKDYTLYSFRHTFIAKLYQAFVSEGLTPNAAEEKLMLITGHTTKTALRAYLRDIDAVLPEDYSSYLNGSIAKDGNAS